MDNERFKLNLFLKYDFLIEIIYIAVTNKFLRKFGFKLNLIVHMSFKYKSSKSDKGWLSNYNLDHELMLNYPLSIL